MGQRTSSPVHSAFPPAARRSALMAAAVLLATVAVLAAAGLLDPFGAAPRAGEPVTVGAAARSPLGSSAAHRSRTHRPNRTRPAPVVVPAPVPAPAVAATTAPAPVVDEPAAASVAEPTEEPPVAAAQPQSGGTSGGAGGAFVDQGRQTYSAGNGRSGRYLLYAGGIDPGRPVGLVVYVDGSGEFGVDNPDSSYALGGPSGLVAADRSRNVITLAVESPDQGCECWHTGDTAGNADFLADLVENVMAVYPVGELWLAGFSSGAQEITRFLVPRHPELMRLGGGWVVFGGGGPPDGSTGLTAAQMSGVRGHWFTGTADGSVPLTASWGAQPGGGWYPSHGVVTSQDWAAGVGHELGGRLGSTVGRLVDGG